MKKNRADGNSVEQTHGGIVSAFPDIDPVLPYGGEGRGGVGCVGFPFAVGALGLLWHCVLGGGGVCRWEEGWSRSSPCLRPSHPGNARSRLISEAKQGRAWLVLGWETSWEYRVL